MTGFTMLAEPRHRIRRQHNYVAYDPSTGDILQCGTMRATRLDEQSFPGTVMALDPPVAFDAATSRVDIETLTVVDKD